MAEPDNSVLEILRELRTEMREGFQVVDLRFDALERKFDAKFASLEDRVDVLEIKLDGLSHALMSGFGSMVRELKDINGRVTLLEAEHA